MQRKTIIILLCVVCSSIVYAQVSINQGMVAYYPFSGNAQDSTANANNGTVQSGVTLTIDRFGNNNRAYNFDGTNNAWIDVASSASLNTGTMKNLALSVWFRPTNGNASNTNRNIVQLLDPQNRNYTITYNYTTSKIDFYNWNGLTGTNNINFSSVSNLTPNNWYHLVLRIDSVNHTELYINNNLEGSSNISVLKPISPSLVIGRHPLVGGYWNFFGVIDELRIYNRYVSNYDIGVLYYGCSISNVNLTHVGNTSFCQGDSVLLNVTPQDTFHKYTWLLDGSAINGAKRFTYLAKQKGNYTVRLDSAFCTITTSSVPVVVNTIPSVSVSLGSNLINIQSNPTPITGVPIGGTYTGKGVAGSSFVPSNAGLGTKTISYFYTDGNGCSNSSFTKTIVYDTIACFVTDTIHIAKYDTTHFSKYDTIHVAKYDTIHRLDTLKITLTDTLHFSKYDTIHFSKFDTIHKFDTITAHLSRTDTLIINASLTGVPGPNNINTLKIYPNPARNHVIIDYGNYTTMGGYTIKITNSLGQIIYAEPINQQQTPIDLTQWSGVGLYFVSIVDNLGNTIENRKIVLQ